MSALNVYIKLARAAESVSARVNRHLADVNLTISQFGALETLYHLGPLHQRQLAEKILKSTSNMTLVIDNLVKRELVERQRDLSDRRYITIHLTDAGRCLIEKIFPQHVATIAADIGILTLEEQDQLATLCRKLGLRE